MRLKKPILSMPAVLGLALFLDVTSPVAADTPAVIKPSSPAEGAEFFESKIRPILADNCFTCHGSKKQKAGFRLDSRPALIKGSENGPVVVPGQPVYLCLPEMSSALLRARGSRSWPVAEGCCPRSVSMTTARSRGTPTAWRRACGRSATSGCSSTTGARVGFCQ